MRSANHHNLKRVIVDFKKLSNAILDLLVIRYPDGFGDSDIIAFKNQYHETIECVEVRTEDTIYLVKVSKRLVGAMEDFNGYDEVHDEEMDIEPTED